MCHSSPALAKTQRPRRISPESSNTTIAPSRGRFPSSKGWTSEFLGKAARGGEGGVGQDRGKSQRQGGRTERQANAGCTVPFRDCNWFDGVGCEYFNGPLTTLAEPGRADRQPCPLAYGDVRVAGGAWLTGHRNGKKRRCEYDVLEMSVPTSSNGTTA